MSKSLEYQRPDNDAARAIAVRSDLPEMMAEAAELRDRHYGRKITYSRKVFIPLTKLCRDVCHYCTFAQPPRNLEEAFLSPEQVLAIARDGAAAGCKEALFTLGDKPELRYQAARDALAEFGHETTLSYLREMALLVFEETGLLPHLNPGVLEAGDYAALREVSASMGSMLESASPRLLEKGFCHHGSPDKDPEIRIASMAEAGRQKVPFTSGILIGIGETRLERIEALLALRDLQDEYGHIQEIIIQNFRAKPDTLMANAPEPSLEDLQWTIAAARLLFGPEMSIQAPPNLSGDNAADLIPAGINDWGGVSPVTRDHVNPEAPWPHLATLAQATARQDKILCERLAVYPDYIFDGETWLDPAFRTDVLRRIDSDGLARTDNWSPGMGECNPLPAPMIAPELGASRELDAILARGDRGEDLAEHEIVRLFAARAGEVEAVAAVADGIRRRVNGDTVSYVVNRNINYTNVCYFGCKFCAFSKGKTYEELRGKPYDLAMDEIIRRAEEAWDRGATEVCLQGGIHPDYTGETYLEILRAIKSVLPELHVHAFTPLEVFQGAKTLDLPLDTFLGMLRDEGLGTLPGTAAEILDDEVRATLCPDKINTDQWLEVMETAHGLGLRSTATIMFGHIERPVNWARHLLRLRELQSRTGGFSELVPLPFVHMEAPIYLKGAARKGPTWREALLMHAVSRIALHPHFTNVQASWVKLGADGIAACLDAGCNDVGGTLMNETITRSAGAAHGQEMPPEQMEDVIAGAGRSPR
ncbi:MAG: hypothetical protein CMM59_10865, partial [Rhodospirillaceae bacterium]|nr:hypothetical protein [Rhodospirillaceae bacterium]